MIHAIEFTAVIASCVFGILQARRFGMDFLGVFTVAFATAFGGGTLRDVLLDRRPLFWMDREYYLITVFAVVLAATLISRIPRAVQKHLYIPDALGLGLFSIVGTQFALEAGMGWFTSAFLGVITGAFGGVISDIICNEVPAIFRPAPLYATCAFAGSWIYIALLSTPLQTSIAMFIAAASVVLFRLIAVWFDIQLPAVSTDKASD